MQCYVINLDRSPERLHFFQTQAKACGLDVQRVVAVDGKQLCEATIAKVRRTPFQFQPIDTGNIGLLLSHQRVWEKLVQSDAEYAAVFEDDAILAPSIGPALHAIDVQRPEFDVIKLETTLRRVVCSRQAESLNSEMAVQRLLTWHGGTAGYVISRRGAEHLLAMQDTSADIIDLLMFHPFSKAGSKLVIGQLIPAVCIQSQFLAQDETPAFESTLGKPSVGDQFLRYGLWIDSRRFVRRQTESIRRKLLARQSANEQLTVPFASAGCTHQAA